MVFALEHVILLSLYPEYEIILYLYSKVAMSDNYAQSLYSE